MPWLIPLGDFFKLKHSGSHDNIPQKSNFLYETQISTRAQGTAISGSYISSVSYLSNPLLKLEMSMGQDSNTVLGDTHGSQRISCNKKKKMQPPKGRGQNRERQRKEGEGQRKGGKKREGGEREGGRKGGN